MGISVNFTDLTAYTSAMTVFTDDFFNFLKDFIIEMAERVISKTKPRTPVDTSALKGAWKLGNIVGYGERVGIEILNPMEYATEVEYGHRIVHNNIEYGWYEGRFMLTVSLDEIRKQMPLRYEKQFRAFCASKGILI